MKVGIIGGGAAGLITAWLLEPEHEVALFERDPTLGGHARSVYVSTESGTCAVNTGFHFFYPSGYPLFMRLLHALDVPIRRYKSTGTFYDRQREWSLPLPPWGSAGRMMALAQPRSISTMRELQRTFSHARQVFEDDDMSLTLDEFSSAHSLNPVFLDQFLYPFLSSNWGVTSDEIRTFSARDTLNYVCAQSAKVLRPEEWAEIEGGTQRYINVLAQACTRATIHADRGVESLSQSEEGFWARTCEGATERFDHAVVATDAEQAERVVRGCADEAVCNALSRFEYFDTRIVVHGDTGFMPPRRSHWSVANLMYENGTCAITHWAGWRTREHVFRTWVTHSPTRPSNAWDEVKYRHPKPNRAYFEAQQDLANLQGQNNLWFAGMYTCGIDNHESAVRSAINIAQKLAPGSPRLRALESMT